jgi:Raf kinase inhibitor-like YbhB/YbcL family protein
MVPFFKNKNIIVILLAVAGWAVVLTAIFFIIGRRSVVNPRLDKIYFNNNMMISSPDFIDGGPLPEKCGCHGRNINPTLKFSGIPLATQSLALIVDDPDAPLGIWTHWLVFNINPKTVEIKAGETFPPSFSGRNDSGNFSYDGPCPPSGTHHYYFRLYALDKTFSLARPVLRSALLNAFSGHILAEATLIGTYRH